MAKTSSASRIDHKDNNVKRLVTIMTWVASIILGIGVLLCLMNLSQFNDRNPGLMVGIGFMVGSVFIYFIITAMGLVHERRQSEEELTQLDKQ